MQTKAKLKLMAALAAALVLAPAPAVFAADDPAAEKAKPKKRIPKKPFYTRFAEAMAAAESNDEPVLVLLSVENNGGKKSPALRKEETSKILEKELFKAPLFMKEYAKSNLVLLKMKLKTDKTGKLLEERSSLRTDEERRFINEYGVDPVVAKRVLQKDSKKLKPLDLDNYPSVICVKGNVDKQTLLFRMPAYSQSDGFGPWLSSLHGMLQSKKIEPVVSPKVQKVLDEPTAFGGKKKR